MSIILTFLYFFNSSGSSSFKIGYLTPIFSNIHKNMFVDSKIVSTLSCGHPVRVNLKQRNANWYKVKTGPYIGYIKKIDIKFKKIKCFQDKYPKFFNKFNFSVDELYLWGKLNDRFSKGYVRFR